MSQRDLSNLDLKTLPGAHRAHDILRYMDAHLFVPAKQIYNILDGEYNRRQGQLKSHILSDVSRVSDLQIVRNRMLNAVKQNQK